MNGTYLTYTEGDVEKIKAEIAKRDAEIAGLRSVLKHCHDNVYQQKELAALVYFYYHEFFSDAYNPHAKPTTSQSDS